LDQLLFPGCFVCGPDNVCGLKAVFKTLDSGDVEGVFTPDQGHCGYEGIVHGGILMGFLDEVLGRLAFTRDRLFLTHTLEVTFRKAASPGAPLRAVARETNWSRRKFAAEGILTDKEGDIVATARGTFLIMSEGMEKELISGGGRKKEEK
jgi:uncharacterized protein (TIGR00369 family)